MSELLPLNPLQLWHRKDEASPVYRVQQIGLQARGSSEGTAAIWRKLYRKWQSRIHRGLLEVPVWLAGGGARPAREEDGSCSLGPSGGASSLLRVSTVPSPVSSPVMEGTELSEVERLLAIVCREVRARGVYWALEQILCPADPEDCSRSRLKEEAPRGEPRAPQRSGSAVWRPEDAAYDAAVATDNTVLQGSKQPLGPRQVQKDSNPATKRRRVPQEIAAPAAKKVCKQQVAETRWRSVRAPLEETGGIGEGLHSSYRSASPGKEQSHQEGSPQAAPHVESSSVLLQSMVNAHGSAYSGIQDQPTGGTILPTGTNSGARTHPFSKGRPVRIWVVGHSYIYWLGKRVSTADDGKQLGFSREEVDFRWLGLKDLKWQQLVQYIKGYINQFGAPDILLIHAGGSDIGKKSLKWLLQTMRVDIVQLMHSYPRTMLIWSEIIRRCRWKKTPCTWGLEKVRIRVNRAVSSLVINEGGVAIRHREFEADNMDCMFMSDRNSLSDMGMEQFILDLKSGIQEALSVGS